MASKNQVGKNQTKDLKCATHLMSEKFGNMSEEKKEIVRDLGFGGMMHIPPLRVHHKLLKELANSFKLGKNTLETGYGLFRVRPSTIGATLGLNASGDIFSQKVSYKELSEENKQIFRRFQGKTLKNLTDEMMTIAVENEQDRLMFKRIFILYIQMGIVKMAETKEKLKQMKKKDKKEKTKKTKKGKQVHHHQRLKHLKLKSILPLTLRLKKTQRDQKGNNPPEQPKKLNPKNRKKNQEDSDSETESNDESEESSPVEKQKTKKKSKLIVEDSSPEQTQSYHGSEIGTEELEELLRESKKKKNNEKYVAQGEKGADMRSKEGHYDSSKTIPDVNLGSDDPLSQGHTDQSSINKPAESMLNIVEESANEPAEENMMVVRVET
ncbi:uncharacterized protein DS421_19g660360 [Arachis hypogaea]|uniref:Uncharacterized protein n=1 Tax=Arachis hypogaea TaxID=3818 RepID=A0A6B9VA02_ARAHY|nr:uncharacterized protein DS421_19g660360 [Arachis hypogaea]